MGKMHVKVSKELWKPARGRVPGFETTSSVMLLPLFPCRFRPSLSGCRIDVGAVFLHV